MSEQLLILQVEVSPTFNRNLRAIANKYRSIRNDIQPIIEQLDRGSCNRHHTANHRYWKILEIFLSST
ncbi:MAG: hypothetical protein QQW96_20810 [Tychonema bourrellyi B0820]|uniref:hypothetical protein n=1 Tax=Tychonema bourrellyi TaxID=54313 RepID=UPI001C5590CF|nr:hypothetical protein [Tychonema bourrellyi]MDQ2100077.1 hypothetical protein [Tychonema bourrellyi B0820]